MLCDLSVDAGVMNTDSVHVWKATIIAVGVIWSCYQRDCGLAGKAERAVARPLDDKRHYRLYPNFPTNEMR